jgi:hypothetical protein
MPRAIESAFISVNQWLGIFLHSHAHANRTAVAIGVVNVTDGGQNLQSRRAVSLLYLLRARLKCGCALLMLTFYES